MMHHYARFKPFAETEAWTLFKIAAIGEAVGWTCLGSAVLSHNSDAVTIAGQIHGTLFVVYIAAALALGPSLGWGSFRTLIAGLCSIPPYGTLIYELWSGQRRRRSQLRRLQTTAQYHLLITASSM